MRRNSASKRQHSAPEYLERRRAAYKRATSFNQKLRLKSRDRKSSLDGRKDSLVEEDDRERKTSTASCPDDKKVGGAGGEVGWGGRIICWTGHLVLLI